MPRWWNSTASEQLQLLIIQAGDAPFQVTLPAGPVFTATYTTPSTGIPASAQTNSVSSVADAVTNVQAASSSSSSSSHLSGGKVAAAVIMPLLVAAAFAAFLWIRRSRARGKEKRKQWTEKIDKRMSVVSSDWHSISVVGAQAAIRNSMAVRGSASMDRSRTSFAEMAQRDSMVANLAGMGVQAPGGGVGGFFIPGQEDPIVNPIMAMPTPSIPGLTRPSSVLSTTSPQVGPPLRPGLGNGVGVGLRSSAYSNAAVAARVSRVSFAEPAGKVSIEGRRSIYDRERPSMDSRRSIYSQNTQNRGSRAYHYANDEDEEEMPPLPEGAAERASQFYMLGSGVGVGLASNGSSLGGHMNVSTSSLGSGSQEAFRLSRFDEIYGQDGYDYVQENEGQDHDYSQGTYLSPEISPAYPSSTYATPSFPSASPPSYPSSPSPISISTSLPTSPPDAGVMSPTQKLGPVALSTEDIKRRISMRSVRSASRNGSNGSNGNGSKESFGSGFEDVGPALTSKYLRSVSLLALASACCVFEIILSWQLLFSNLNLSCIRSNIFLVMRVQDQEDEQGSQGDYFTHSRSVSVASAAFASGAFASESDTLFTASPSPYQTSFDSVNSTEASVASPVSPAQETPSYTSLGGMAPPKNGFSPDDMLKAYAGRKASASSISSAPRAPSPSTGGAIGGIKNGIKGLKGKITNPSPLAKSFSVHVNVQEHREDDYEENRSGHAM